MIEALLGMGPITKGRGPVTDCYQLDPVTLGLIMGGSAGVGALGNIVSGIFGSSASEQAAQEAALGQYNALAGVLSGQQSAVSALSPYYTGGLENYDVLNYLLTGTTGNAQPLTPAQQAQLTQAQNWLNAYNANPNPSVKEKYASMYESNLATVQNLTNQQSAYQAQQQAGGAAAGTGLPAGYLSTPFNLNTAMESGTGNQMLNLATNQIAAQRAATGGYGSGNQATDLSNYIAGTFEPTLYGQYTGNQQQLFNMLTGNTGGAGQNAATNVANVYTGSAATGAPYSAGIGSSQAAGTLGSANAITNALTGTGNQATNLAGMYLTLQGNQGLLNAINGLGAGSYGIGGANSSPYFNPAYNDLWGYAEGGRPPVGKPVIVGEKGIELFIPDESGTIIPNSLLKSIAFIMSMGGGKKPSRRSEER
jgi:hypothetical protein